MKNNFFEFLFFRFGYFLYFLLTNIILICVFNYINIGDDFLKFTKSTLVSCIFIFIFVFLFYYLLTIIRVNRTFLKILAGGGCLLIFITGILNIILIINFNTLFTYAIFISILNTNINESLEFITMYLNMKTILSIIVFIFYTHFIIKLKIKIKISNKINLFLIILFILIFLTNDVRRVIKLKNHERFLNIPTVTLLKYICFSDDSYLEYENILNSYKNIVNKHVKLNAYEDIKNIVLIIGESSRRDGYSDYISPLNTSINIDKIKNKIVFSDVVTPYSYTHKTLSLMLNFSNLDTEKSKKFYESLDIINLFNLANYKTFYISNQDYSSVTAPISSFAYYENYINKQVDVNTLMRIRKLDEELLPFIDKVKQDENNFVILHIMGNHADYEKRYPENFKTYKAEDIKRDLSNKDRDIIANYYNSILYTDFVISKIVNKFKNSDSLIIYLSDHGELLKDGSRYNIFGHGIIDKQTIEIPFFIFYSDFFKEKHSKLLERLINSKDLAFMSDDLIHLICDIAGIDTKEFDATRSPINMNYNKHRKRVIENTIDYDKEIKKY